jgi:hypothetical protein
MRASFGGKLSPRRKLKFSIGGWFRGCRGLRTGSSLRSASLYSWCSRNDEQQSCISAQRAAVEPAPMVSFAPARRATAPKVVCAAFRPSRKSPSEK